MQAIKKNDTWELVNLPQGKQVIRVKWVYNTKSNIEGKIERHKARLVVKGYKQQHGRDYVKTFAPIARIETVRTVVAIAAQHKWKVYQMDVKLAFLNGVLKEEVYVAQPPGYEVEGKEDKVYRLKKALYTLKQAPCAWYNKIDAYLLDNGFDKCDGEPTLYIKENDDILEKFKIQNSKPAPTPTVMGLKLSKEDCSSNANPTLYKIMIGSLMYLTAIRSDIMYAVSLVSRFMETPKKTHWQAAKRILRYVNGTKQYGVLYTTTDDFRLVGYTDSDWAGNVDGRKSMSGYVFHLGSGVISWASKKQPIVSLSTAEAEYVAAIAATSQAVQMRRMLRDLHRNQEGATTIFCNNTSTIALSKNSVLDKRPSILMLNIILLES
eukprot:PITA_11602